MEIKKSLPIVIIIFSSLIITLFFFYPITENLNKVLFAGGGDGIKNYFTYLFYINNDSGTHFTGMNYPFGENVIFTDNTPALAWIIKVLNSYFPGVSVYALGIMHITLLAALTVGVIFIFKILKKFGVANWWAIPSALFIIYFSPQIFKFSGHFGLAFLCYLPMQIYWLTEYHRSGKWKYMLYIALWTVLFTFLHVYQLAFTLVLCSSYIVSYLIIYRGIALRSKIRRLFPVLVSIFSTCIAFSLYLKLTDHVTDRTSYPYGVFGATTINSEIFSSAIAPLGFVFQFLFGNAHGPTEGYTYIGFISILVIAFLFYKIIRAIVLSVTRRKRTPAHPIRSFRIWLWVALFQILFAMGVPFIWNLQFLADYIATLRQFRAMGRFSWSFYYLIMIFCSIFLYRLYRWMKTKKYYWQANSIIAATLIIWVVQMSGYAQWINKNIVQSAVDNYNQFYSKSELTWVRWLEKKGVKASQFQAILALPFVHIGSEKLWLQDNDAGRTMFYGYQFALQTGVPLIDVMMSRTSWSQTFATVQLVDGPFSAKYLLDSFSSKPIIVLVNKHSPLKTKEKEWIKNAVFIGDRKDIDIYSVNIQNLRLQEKRLRDSFAILAENEKQNEGLLGDKHAFYYTNHYDSRKQKTSFLGQGSYAPKLRQKEQLLIQMTPSFPEQKEHVYTFSIWVKCNNTDYRSPAFVFRQYDANNTLIDESDLPTKYSTHVIKYWFLAEKNISLKKEMKTLKIYVIGGDRGLNYLALDELSFWPANSVYYYKTNNELSLNNRPQ